MFGRFTVCISRTHTVAVNALNHHLHCVPISAKGLGGAMFWCLDLDDFKGSQCSEGKYPLIRAVAKALGGYTPQPEPTPGPLPPTTKSPTKTKKPGVASKTEKPGGGKCQATGPWTGNANMNTWCVLNCALGYCPDFICKC